MTWWILAAILSQPTPELGTIRWERSWDNAVARARGEHKPILVLFDEIPGCSTVLAFGRTVLSAPDVVATVETYFVPLAVVSGHQDPRDSGGVLGLSRPSLRRRSTCRLWREEGRGVELDLHPANRPLKRDGHSHLI